MNKYNGFPSMSEKLLEQIQPRPCSFCDVRARWYRLMGGYVRHKRVLSFNHIFACDSHKRCLMKDARHDLKRQFQRKNLHGNSLAVYPIREIPW